MYCSSGHAFLCRPSAWRGHDLYVLCNYDENDKTDVKMNSSTEWFQTSVSGWVICAQKIIYGSYACLIIVNKDIIVVMVTRDMLSVAIKQVLLFFSSFIHAANLQAYLKIIIGVRKLLLKARPLFISYWRLRCDVFISCPCSKNFYTVWKQKWKRFTLENVSSVFSRRNRLRLVWITNFYLVGWMRISLSFSLGVNRI